MPLSTEDRAAIESLGGKYKESGEALLKEFEEKLAPLNQLVEEQALQLKEYGETAAATGKAIAEKDAAIAALEKSANELRAELKELDSQSGRLSGAGGINGKSLFETFSESEAYLAFQGNSAKSSDRVKINLKEQKDYQFATGSWAGSVGRVTPSGATLGSLYTDGIVLSPQRELTMLDLVNVVTISSPRFSFPRQIGYNPKLTIIRSNSNSTTTTLFVENCEGFAVGNRLTINPGGADETVTVTGVDRSTSALTIEPALAAAPPANTRVRGLEGPVATPWLHRKPQIGIQIDAKERTTKTIAAWTPAARQAIADVAQLEDLINNDLVHAVHSGKEWMMLNGNEAEEREFGGFYQDIDVQHHNRSANTGDTMVDSIRRMHTKARLARYAPEALLMHPNDFAALELTKGNDNHYVWVPSGEGINRRLWRATVVETESIKENDALLGNFSMGCTLYQQDEIEIFVADQHADFFTKNALAILAEERAGFAIKRPEAFVIGHFDQ